MCLTVRVLWSIDQSGKKNITIGSMKQIGTKYVGPHIVQKLQTSDSKLLKVLCSSSLSF